MFPRRARIPRARGRGETARGARDAAAERARPGFAPGVVRGGPARLRRARERAPAPRRGVARRAESAGRRWPRARGGRARGASGRRGARADAARAAEAAPARARGPGGDVRRGVQGARRAFEIEGGARPGAPARAPVRARERTGVGARGGRIRQPLFPSRGGDDRDARARRDADDPPGDPRFARAFARAHRRARPSPPPSTRLQRTTPSSRGHFFRPPRARGRRVPLSVGSVR